MKTHFRSSEIVRLKVRPEQNVPPIWVKGDDGSFSFAELSELPIENQLKAEIEEWNSIFQNILNWEDPSVSYISANDMETEFHYKGMELTDKLKEQLGSQYFVTYEAPEELEPPKKSLLRRFRSFMKR